MIQSTNEKQTTNKYYLLASKNLEKKDYKLAKSNLLKYLKKNQDHQALNLLGICHLYVKEYLEAAKVFKELVSNKITSDSIFNNYGNALKNLKEFNAASIILNNQLN